VISNSHISIAILLQIMKFIFKTLLPTWLVMVVHPKRKHLHV